jgi:uncharacterized protein (DUF697 family)
MPAITKKSSRFGKLGGVRSFVSVIREVNFEEVRASAELAPRLLVLAPTEAEAEEIGDALAGISHSPYVFPATLDAFPRSGDAYDAVVVFDPTTPDRATRVGNSLRARELKLPVVSYVADHAEDVGVAERVREAIVAQALDRAPALGRHIPAFRPAAVKAIIDETARANAQFAAVANLPSIVPVFGSLMSAGADMLVLTKNQAMMIYKLAACHDRDLRDQWRIIWEVVPVVGAGFFWRSLAREAASFLPVLIGTLPKVGVAYVGTVVAGRGADLYYRSGKKPNRTQMQAIYRQAVEAMKRLPPGNLNPTTRESGRGVSRRGVPPR